MDWQVKTIRRLFGLALLAIVYLAVIRTWQRLTGNVLIDGYIGVMLGLYICSHPAANFISLILYERRALRRLPSNAALIRWIALNSLVLLVGWMVIFNGFRLLAAGLI